MLNIEQVALQRANETKTPYLEWINVFTEGIELQSRIHLAGEEFTTLAENCHKPAQFALIVEALDEYVKEYPEVTNGLAVITEHVNDSVYGLAQWVEAIEYFYEWLGQNQLNAGLVSLLEYISCCTQSPQSFGGKIPLRDVLTDMLDQYGFEQS